MVIVILVIGINLMNNYQKMKKFDKSISSLMVQMSGNDTATQEEVVPVNKLEGGDILQKRRQQASSWYGCSFY